LAIRFGNPFWQSVLAIRFGNPFWQSVSTGVSTGVLRYRHCCTDDQMLKYWPNRTADASELSSIGKDVLSSTSFWCLGCFSKGSRSGILDHLGRSRVPGTTREIGITLLVLLLCETTVVRAHTVVRDDASRATMEYDSLNLNF
jgi:hypothetical protein